MTQQEALFEEEPTLSVGELSAGIGNLVNRAYPDEIWVRGEIANLNRPASRHVYFDLVGDGCSLAVTLWASDRAVVNGVLKRAGGQLRIVDGTEVRIRVRVTWYPERGRVSLRMLSIDTAFTLGRLAEQRDLLVQAFTREGLLDRQARLPLAPLPLRIGLITSTASAAARDFLHTLETSGFAWDVTLADARVQGTEAEASIVAAISVLCSRRPNVDVVCIVRGGGSRTDLVAFDRELVARAIAIAPVPIMTGIGHEIDTTVADLVAHERHKTPTACAAALVERVATWCGQLHDTWEAIASAGEVALARSERRVGRASGRAVASARQHLRAQEGLLGAHRGQLVALPRRALDERERTLEHIGARVRAADPVHVLARGWSITRDESGALVRSADVTAGTKLVTTFADGAVRSTVDR